MNRLKAILLSAFALCLGLVHVQDCRAQQFGNSDNMAFDNYKLMTDYEVKVIDEFIERFNNDKNSQIRQAFEAKGVPFNVSRKRMLQSLINLGNKSLMADTEKISKFIKDVTNAETPITIAFTDSNWYTEAMVVVRMQKKTMLLPVILHVKTKKDEWSKWMIAGVGDPKPFVDPTHSVPDDYKPTTIPTYIPTSSYATDFADLNYAFSDYVNYTDFMEPDFLASPNGKKLTALLKANDLRFLYVDAFRFYFFQIDTWAFEVARFTRNTLNSGWLIDKLYAATDEDKKNLTDKLLHLGS